MKKRFRFEDYRGNYYVMHCETEAEAIAFCKVMHEDGRKWWTGDNYLDNSKWSEYEELTCYEFNTGESDFLSYYKFYDFLILEYSDFDWSKQFTKSDLVPVFKATNFKLTVNGVDIDITDDQAKRMGFLKITKEEQDALHDELNKKLRKFSYENGGLDIDLSNPNTDKYHLTFDSYIDNISCEIANMYIGLSEVYFKSGKVADRAIEEIVKPFMKENPQFVW